MSQNQEIIESKLCAFVDGEVDEAGRAEIEKHLLANPQHRRLLEELRRTSALLRGLPRESSPPEMAESFNAQLERSVLLHGIGSEVARPSLRINSGPQLYAAAAIILLTVGLAAVIYFALPARTVHPTFAATQGYSTASDHNAANTPLNQKSERLEKQQFANGGNANTDAVGGRSVAEKEGLQNKDMDKRPADADALAFARADESSRLRQLARQVASSVGPVDAQRMQLDPARGPAEAVAGQPPSLSPSAVLMVLQSEDVKATRQQVASYLNSNGIKWEPAEDSTTPASGGTALGADAGTGGARALEREATLRDREEAAKGIDAAKVSPAPARAAEKPTTDKPSATAVPEPAPAAADTTQPALAPAAPPAPVARATGPGKAGTQPSTVPEDEIKLHGLPDQAGAGGNAASELAPRQLVLAARMSRRQAAQLSDALQRDGALREARVVNDDDDAPKGEANVQDGVADQLRRAAAAAKEPQTRPAVAKSYGATTQPADEILGDLKKSVTGPAVPDSSTAAASGTTRPSEDVVSNSRNGTRFGIGRGGEYRSDVADASKDASASTTQPATPSVAAAGSAPTLQPTAAPGASLQGTTRPASAELELAAGQRKREILAEAGEPNADELVNVVILVRADAPAADAGPKASSPATQPSEPATPPATDAPTTAPANQPAAPQ